MMMPKIYTCAWARSCYDFCPTRPDRRESMVDTQRFDRASLSMWTLSHVCLMFMRIILCTIRFWCRGEYGVYAVVCWGCENHIGLPFHSPVIHSFGLSVSVLLQSTIRIILGANSNQRNINHTIQNRVSMSMTDYHFVHLRVYASFYGNYLLSHCSVEFQLID